MIDVLNTEKKRDKMPTYIAPPPQFVEIRIDGKHLFNFDPARGLITIRRNGEQYTVDLSQYAAR